MKILARLLALFLIMPAVELALLFVVGEYVGFLPTIGLIILTGVVGGFLAKREGLSVWNRLKDRLDGGGLPGKELLDGVIILVAGALLITPGVLTDLIGFLGLLPPTRALIRKCAMKRIKKAMRDGTLQTTFAGGYGEAAWAPEGDAFGYGASGEAPYDAYEEAHYEDLSDPAVSDEKKAEGAGGARSPYAPPLPERSASESDSASASHSSGSHSSGSGASERERKGEPPRPRSGGEVHREAKEVGETRARSQQRDAIEDE